LTYLERELSLAGLSFKDANIESLVSLASSINNSEAREALSEVCSTLKDALWG
jgi:hypothetical protein